MKELSNEERALARQKANEYKRKWAKANKDKIRASQQRYWLKKALAEKEGVEDDGANK